MSLLEDLQWRYATKAYDPTKKVSRENIEKIIEAARLAPTSSGLQPFRVIILENREIRAKLVKAVFNPECMQDCSHVLIFAAWDRYTPESIDEVYTRETDERGLPGGRFSHYTDMIKELYASETKEEHFIHTARQSYIGLAMALAQAAELRIDSTPAEGFDNAFVDKELQLDRYGLKSVLLLYLGYRDSKKDWRAPMKKVRVPTEEFVIEIT